MKNMTLMVALLALIVGFSSSASAYQGHWRERDASGDHYPKSFKEGYEYKMKRFDDGFVLFPGAEIGMGSGALSAAIGLNIGYKSGLFLIGTSLKGQVINIDHVNYAFMPYTLNVSGVSYSMIPETSNSQNDKKLKGWSIGYGMGGKLTFAQLVETDPVTQVEKEYLTINIGFGF
ncbi:hypothetical protein KKI24_15015 [bacterium]|nr:hypothetical protein [bacterium]